MLRFDVTIPSDGGIADPRQGLAMGPLAEALGYDSVWVMDPLRPLFPLERAVSPDRG